MSRIFGEGFKHEVAAVGGILQIWSRPSVRVETFWVNRLGFNKEMERTATEGECIVSGANGLPHSRDGVSRSQSACLSLIIVYSPSDGDREQHQGIATPGT